MMAGPRHNSNGLKLGDILQEFDERLGSQSEPEILTLTEKMGFVAQRERFKKRLAISDTSNYKVVGLHDIAFNPYLLWAGAIAQNTAWPKAIISPLYPTFRVRQGYSPRFVNHLLCGGFLLPSYDAISHGSVPRKRRSAVADFLNLHIPMPVPPLADQERIVKLLDEADALRKLRAQADRRTTDIIPALFNEMFGDENYPVATVADVADKREGSIRTGPFGSDLRHSEFVETGIPVLGIDNVVENEFRWTKPRCVTPQKFEEMRRFVVSPNDVLTTIMGTVGRCAVAPADLPVCISTKHLCVVSVDRKRIEPRYLWACFLFDNAIRQQTQNVARGAIMEGWNSTIIKQLIVRVPPLSLQKQFTQRVTEIRALETAQAASRARLDALFQSMLHRAFNGDL